MKDNRYFHTAVEYYRNARHILKETPIELGAFYQSRKNVQKAAGLCFLALDNAVKGYLVKKGLDEKNLPETWDGLKFTLLKHFSHNGRFRKELEIAYRLVHLSLYYRGETRVILVKEGFDKAKTIIENLSKAKV
ncbi:MAG: DUF5618 family protein [Candidatus Edwardsbacteria bacterium]